MNSCFEVTLRLPNILELSDDEMAKHFWSYDGRWSIQTKALVEKHGAKGLTLNRNWALVRHWWTCPCCGRDKSQLVRLTPTGILLACLEVHHDHLRDEVNRTFDARFPRPHNTLGPERAHVQTSAGLLVERFSDELVCADCNAADGAAKAFLRGEVHPNFSFSPSEIRQFISVASNAPHKIDPVKALEIWNQQKANFEERRLLVADLAARAAAGSLRRERTTSEARAADGLFRIGHLLEKAFAEATSLHPNQRWSFVAYDHFVLRSTLNQGAGKGVSKNRQRVIAVPTDADFAAVNEEMMKSTPWRTAPLDWRCECCGRSKREICRKSNAGKWTARIYRHEEYVIETDFYEIDLRRALYTSFVADPIIRDVMSLTICQDCAGISAQLKAQRREIPHVYLPIADLKAVISTCEPHAVHEYDLSVAADLALANNSLAEAALAFHEHRRLSLNADMRYRLGKESNLIEGDARAYAAMKLEQQNGLPDDGLDPFIDWLISEGVRLKWRRNQQDEEAANA